MSRSKHQTLKSVAAGQTTSQITAMFEQQDEDAMEFVAKRSIKRLTLKERRAQKQSDKAGLT